MRRIDIAEAYFPMASFPEHNSVLKRRIVPGNENSEWLLKPFTYNYIGDQFTNSNNENKKDEELAKQRGQGDELELISKRQKLFSFFKRRSTKSSTM